MKKSTKVLLVLSAGLLLAGVPSGFAIHYNKQYNDLKNSEQVQSNQGLVSTIKQLQESLKESQSQLAKAEEGLNTITAENEANKALVESLKTQVAALNAQGDADAAEIAVLNKQINDLKDDIVIANSRITSLNNDITNLNTRIDILTAEIDSLTEENEDNLVQIALIEQQLADANSEITRLNGLLEDYKEISELTCEASFYMGETNLHTDAVKFGTTFGELISDVVLPENHGITGWKLADGTSVGEDYVITENVNFYAEYIKVNYYLGDIVLKSFNLTENSQVFENAPRSTSTYRIDGYKAADGTDVDLTSLSVTEDTNLYADYSVIITPTEEEITTYLSSFNTPTGLNLKGVLYCQYDAETGEVDILFNALNSKKEEFVVLLPFTVEEVSNPQELTFTQIVDLYLSNAPNAASYSGSTLYLPEGESYEDGLLAHIATTDTTIARTATPYVDSIEGMTTIKVEFIVAYKNSEGAIVDVERLSSEQTYTTEEYDANSDAIIAELSDNMYNEHVKDKTYLYVS